MEGRIGADIALYHEAVMPANTLVTTSHPSAAPASLSMFLQSSRYADAYPRRIRMRFATASSLMAEKCPLL